MVSQGGAKAFTVKLNRSADADLTCFRKSDQNRILDAIEEQLSHQPTQETRNRKRMRPNPFAERELRVGAFRVYFNVNEEASVVNVVGIGLKEGSKVFFRGEERRL